MLWGCCRSGGLAPLAREQICESGAPGDEQTFGGNAFLGREKGRRSFRGERAGRNSAYADFLSPAVKRGLLSPSCRLPAPYTTVLCYSYSPRDCKKSQQRLTYFTGWIEAYSKVVL